MEAEEAAAKDKAATEPGFLYNVRCHMRNKVTFAEPVPIAAEAVNSATVLGKEKKDGADGDSDGSSYSVSENNEEVFEEVPEKTDKGAIAVLGGVELYKFIDADQGRFTNMVTRLASRA